MLDTCSASSSVTVPLAAIASALYAPDALRCLRIIIAQDDTNPLLQQQISLAASVVAKSCARCFSTCWGSNRATFSSRSHQELLVNAGVLHALARRLASFNLPDKKNLKGYGEDNDRLLPPVAPATARLAPILEALSAIIQGSKIYAIELLFTTPLLVVFPPRKEVASIGTSRTVAGGLMSIYIPKTRSSSDVFLQSPQHILTPANFSPLSTLNSSSSTDFPPLSAASNSHTLNFPTLHNYNSQHSHTGVISDAQSGLLSSGGVTADDSEASTGHNTPLRRRPEMTDVEEDDRLRSVQLRGEEPHQEDFEPDIEVEESEFMNWLISLVRSETSITRLAAASLLTNLLLLGLGKNLHPVLRLLVVPVIVRLLDDSNSDCCRMVSSSCTGVGGIDSRTLTKWTVEEKAPTVLARLVMESSDLQKAAVEAGAIKKLVAMLKQASLATPLPTNCSNGDGPSYADEPSPADHPHYVHRMRLKEGILKCLANLTLFKDEYRREVIDARVIQTLVSSCLKPLPQTSSTVPGRSFIIEGNTPAVLVAACSVVRSVSRSVSILRTSLIDAGIALPIFILLRHDCLAVQVAATMCVCNLLLDFSPMRGPLLDAGALEVLCDLAKSGAAALKLNALWALKHLMCDADVEMKRKAFSRLGPGYIINIITIPDSSICEDDEDMPDTDAELYNLGVGFSGAIEESVKWSTSQDSGYGQTNCQVQTPPKATDALKLLRKQASVAPESLARREQIALQEQAIDFLRNFIYGSSSDAAVLIDLIFDEIGAETLFSLLESLLSVPHPPGEIVNAVVYLVVHLAAGAPRHRQIIMERKGLMTSLLGLWNHRMRDVRNGLVWVVITLTWAEEGPDAEGVHQRVAVLRQMGWVDLLREMRKDVELDVRERVKTAEYQLGVGMGATRM